MKEEKGNEAEEKCRGRKERRKDGRKEGRKEESKG